MCSSATGTPPCLNRSFSLDQRPGRSQIGHFFFGLLLNGSWEKKNSCGVVWPKSTASIFAYFDVF